MLYLNEKDIIQLGIDWSEIINVIENTVYCLNNNEYVQPVKPYLRYRNPKNRIIAMPAFVGGGIETAGIKWIASFPDNIKVGLPRAHSVVILNDSYTGQMIGLINGALLSVIRTAGVSGLIMRYFDDARSLKKINIGIIGWGPIGRYHLKVCENLFSERIENVFLYDIRSVIKMSEVEFFDKARVHIVEKWEEAYDKSDIFITCTVSEAPYINKPPKQGALLLNVSLRDYCTSMFRYVKDSIIVDDWEEVCREKTDIEMMHKEKGLRKEDTRSILDIVCREAFRDIAIDQPVMFNPMGMAVFDIAVGTFYLQTAQKYGNGKKLD